MKKGTKGEELWQLSQKMKRYSIVVILLFVIVVIFNLRIYQPAMWQHTVH